MPPTGAEITAPRLAGSDLSDILGGDGRGRSERDAAGSEARAPLRQRASETGARAGGRTTRTGPAAAQGDARPLRSECRRKSPGPNHNDWATIGLRCARNPKATVSKGSHGPVGCIRLAGARPGRARRAGITGFRRPKEPPHQTSGATEGEKRPGPMRGGPTTGVARSGPSVARPAGALQTTGPPAVTQ